MALTMRIKRTLAGEEARRTFSHSAKRQRVAHPSHSGIQETDLGMIDWTRTDMCFIIALGPNVSDPTRSKPSQKMGRVWFGQLQSILGLIVSNEYSKHIGLVTLSGYSKCS